jgi:predicted ATPase
MITTLPMITTLHLQNFRGFRDHVVEFAKFSVVAGRNNAGKSSAIEALRIVANVANQFSGRRGRFTPSHEWCPSDEVGLRFSTEEFQFKSETVFHNYGEPPAILRAEFDNGIQLEVFIGPREEMFGTLRNPEGRIAQDIKQARSFDIPEIRILPQISPLSISETVLQQSYIRKCLDTHLTSRHFRNQIRYFEEHFDDFTVLVNRTWEGIRISGFESFTQSQGGDLALMLSDRGFTAEAANFGHGLQMWLQIVWFLVRAKGPHILILDEPDVYLHPDQQASLIEILRGRYDQCILSTHAVGIIDSCGIDEVVRLDKRLPKSTTGMDEDTYQQKLTEVQTRVPTVPEAIKVKVVLWEYAEIEIENHRGETILKAKSDGGHVIEELEATELPICFRMLSTDDIDLHVNGRALDPGPVNGEGWQTLNLTELP